MILVPIQQEFWQIIWAFRSVFPAGSQSVTLTVSSSGGFTGDEFTSKLIPIIGQIHLLAALD